MTRASGGFKTDPVVIHSPEQESVFDSLINMLRSLVNTEWLC
jgi:hypothetical protein